MVNKYTQSPETAYTLSTTHMMIHCNVAILQKDHMNIVYTKYIYCSRDVNCRKQLVW